MKKPIFLAQVGVNADRVKEFLVEKLMEFFCSVNSIDKNDGLIESEGV